MRGRFDAHTAALWLAGLVLLADLLLVRCIKERPTAPDGSKDGDGPVPKILF